MGSFLEQQKETQKDILFQMMGTFDSLIKEGLFTAERIGHLIDLFVSDCSKGRNCTMDKVFLQEIEKYKQEKIQEILLRKKKEDIIEDKKREIANVDNYFVMSFDAPKYIAEQTGSYCPT